MLCILVTIACNPVLSNIKSFLKDSLSSSDLNKSNMFNHGVHGGPTNHYKLLNHGTYGPGGHVLGEGAGKVGLFNDDLSVPRAVIPGAAYDIRARKVINNGGKCCDCHGEHHGYTFPHSAALRGFSNMHMMHDRVHEILQPGYAEYMVRSRLGDRRYSVDAQYDLTNWNIINNNMAQRGKYGAYY